jgi:hypothetical protein
VSRTNVESGGRHHLRVAKVRMSSRLDGGYLVVRFEGGSSQRWPLPSKSDPDSIRRTRDAAVQFARQNGATSGQVDAVKKALTDGGYYVSR